MPGYDKDWIISQLILILQDQLKTLKVRTGMKVFPVIQKTDKPSVKEKIRIAELFDRLKAEDK